MEIKDIPKLVNSLQERVSYLESLVPGVELWLSPASASKLLPYNRDQILEMIRAAEIARVQGKPNRLEYGVHYFNTSPEGDRATWKVHRIKFAEVVLRG